MSPISDTTVLSSLACDCNLIKHVMTQVPYVIYVVIISVLLGTIPIGFDAWPNIVGILLGVVAILAFVFLLCVPISSPTGRYDLVTELFIKFNSNGTKEKELIKLREDTIKRARGEEVTMTPLVAKNVDTSQRDEEEVDSSNNEENSSGSGEYGSSPTNANV